MDLVSRHVYETLRAKSLYSPASVESAALLIDVSSCTRSIHLSIPNFEKDTVLSLFILLSLKVVNFQFQFVWNAACDIRGSAMK